LEFYKKKLSTSKKGKDNFVKMWGMENRCGCSREYTFLDSSLLLPPSQIVCRFREKKLSQIICRFTISR